MLLKKKSRRNGAAWWTRAAPEAQSITDVVDPTIEGLDPEARTKLAAIWQKRGGLELRVAAGFSALGIELFEHGTTQGVYEILGQAVRDEIRHAEISVEMAARYRGDGPVWPEPEPLHVPPFAPTTGAMHATLYIIAMCCINETVACGVLEAALGQAKSPLVRAALGTILADEIDHARAGWAHLASPYVTAEMRSALPKWIHRLHAAKLRELVEDDAPLAGRGVRRPRNALAGALARRGPRDARRRELPGVSAGGHRCVVGGKVGTNGVCPFGNGRFRAGMTATGRSYAR